MFYTVINGLYVVLGGSQRPCVHTIFRPVITQLGYKIHVGITDWVRIQFKILSNLVEHDHSIVMDDEDVVDIA